MPSCPSGVVLSLVHMYLHVCVLPSPSSLTYLLYELCTYVPNTPVGLKAAPGSWDRWPVLASLPLLRAAEADQESERAQRQVASARQGVCCAVLVLGACVAVSIYSI